MKYIKLFENFEHTPQEYDQMEVRYTETLNDKSEIINAFCRGEQIKLEPKIRIWAGHGKLDDNFSYSLNFTELNTTHNKELISVTIHDGGSQINVWKDFSVILKNDEIYKIFRMVNDASDYIGGINSDTLESKLFDELSQKPTTWWDQDGKSIFNKLIKNKK